MMPDAWSDNPTPCVLRTGRGDTLSCQISFCPHPHHHHHPPDQDAPVCVVCALSAIYMYSVLRIVALTVGSQNGGSLHWIRVFLLTREGGRGRVYPYALCGGKMLADFFYGQFEGQNACQNF